MESGQFICSDTIFAQCRRGGGRSLLAASKDKLRRLLGDDAHLAYSSEQPTPEAVAAAGEPPHVYSLEVNGWTIDSARVALQTEHYDLAFIATTDYAMHTYGPHHPESARHVAILDGAIGRLANDVPDVQLLITADHGMSDKRRMLHLPEILAKHGIGAQAIPIIKDQYVVHHSNLGGCIYVHLDDPRATADAVGVLLATDGVEDALPRDVAAQTIPAHARPDGRRSGYGRARRCLRRPRGNFFTAGVAFPRIGPRKHGSHHRVWRRLWRVRFPRESRPRALRQRTRPAVTVPRNAVIHMTTVEVRAPATTANLGPGYDCLGMALDIWNRLTVSTLPVGSTPTVQVNGEGEGELAGDTDNLTYRAMAFLYDEADTPIPPLELVCQNGIPLSRGMGSSAAAIAGGLVAANALLDEPFSANDLLEMAATIEGHPDNVAAAVHGGLRLVVMEDNQIYTAPIRIPAELQAVLFIPENRIATVDARRVLPAEISVADAVYNMSRAALLVAAMEGNRPEYLKIATQDRLHQPYRETIFPPMKVIFAAARDAGALGVFPVGQRQRHHGFDSGACNDGGLRNVRRGPVVRRRGSGSRVTTPTELGAHVVSVSSND